jgi:hypothetical protein
MKFSSKALALPALAFSGRHREVLMHIARFIRARTDNMQLD